MTAALSTRNERLVLFALCAGIIGVLHKQHIFDADDGVTLDAAWHVYNGLTPYVDFFEFIGPGSIYLIATIWKLIGVSYWSAKLAAMALLLSGAVAIYGITLIAYRSTDLELPFWLRLWPSVCFCLTTQMWPILSHNSFSIIALLWATWFAMRGLSHPAKLNWLAAGIWLGLAALFLNYRAFAVATVFAAIVVHAYARSRQSAWAKALFLLTTAAIATWSSPVSVDGYGLADSSCSACLLS